MKWFDALNPPIKFPKIGNAVNQCGIASPTRIILNDIHCIRMWGVLVARFPAGSGPAAGASGFRFMPPLLIPLIIHPFRVRSLLTQFWIASIDCSRADRHQFSKHISFPSLPPPHPTSFLPAPKILQDSWGISRNLQQSAGMMVISSISFPVSVPVSLWIIEAEIGVVGINGAINNDAIHVKSYYFPHRSPCVCVCVCVCVCMCVCMLTSWLVAGKWVCDSLSFDRFV